MTIQEMIKKFDISIVRAGANKGKMKVAKGKKATQKELAEIRSSKSEIMEYLEEQHQQKMQERKEEEEQKKLALQAKKDEYTNGREIELEYQEGEYLSGYRVVDSIAGEMLEELGFAHYVDGWGYLAHSEIEELETLTIENATSEKEETLQETKEQDIKESIAQAKMLGHKVEIYRMTTDCDGSVGECSTDIVVGYVDGEGSKTSERIHTY